MELLINIDVDDLARGDDGIELLGGSSKITA